MICVTVLRRLHLLPTRPSTLSLRRAPFQRLQQLSNHLTGLATPLLPSADCVHLLNTLPKRPITGLTGEGNAARRWPAPVRLIRRPSLNPALLVRPANRRIYR